MHVGGEDSIRRQVINDVDDDEGISAAFPHLKGVRNGDTASSKIKQIASGNDWVDILYVFQLFNCLIKAVLELHLHT